MARAQIAACTTPRLEVRGRCGAAASAPPLRFSYRALCALRPQALARVFRGESNCSELRKAHVLYLARAWRYKSDLWCVPAAA